MYVPKCDAATKVHSFLLSAFEEKNDCSLFEGLFKVEKNGVFLFGLSFFVIEIFNIWYYANEESADVIHVGGSSKTVQHLMKNIFRGIKAVFCKLDTRNVYH